MRLILHIGTEKTATTTLQEFVYHNRDALLQRGVGLSDLLGVPTNRKLVAFCMPPGQFDDYFKDRQIRTEEAKAAYFKGFESALADEVRARAAEGATTMFISSEHFHSRLRDHATIQRLKTLLDANFDDVRVVCYFREQSAMLASLYSTAIKSGNIATLETFARHCSPDNAYYNYKTFFARWRDVFGRDALVPRLYTREQFVGGDIRRDLLALLLGHEDAAGFDFTVADANRSLGAVGIELGRIGNKVFGRYRADGSVNERRLEFMAALSRSELGLMGDWHFASAERVYELFAPSNRAFAAEFLGQDGNPFARPKSPDAAHEATLLQVPLPVLSTFFEQYFLHLRAIDGEPEPDGPRRRKARAEAAGGAPARSGAQPGGPRRRRPARTPPPPPPPPAPPRPLWRRVLSGLKRRLLD